MWGYPSATEILRSPLSVPQVLERIQHSIEPDVLWGIFHREPFRGSVVKNTFSIRRNSSNGKANPPQLTGVVEAAQFGPGSTLTVEYRERTFALVASTVIGLFITAYAASQVYSDTLEKQSSLLTLLIPPACLLAFVAVQVASFRFEVWKSRRALAKLLPLEKVA